MQQIEVFIPSTTSVGSYVLYNLEIDLVFNKFRTEKYQISKRFSDFVKLRQHIIEFNENTSNNEKNINIPDLPSKYTSFYKSKEAIVNERKIGLTNFMQIVLSNEKLRIIDNVLNFLNIPKSIMYELNMLNESPEESSKLNTDIINNTKINKIDSAQQWMDIFKVIKSLIQDSRTKMFSSGNTIEIRKNLRKCESKTDLLKQYLTNTKELGYGEIRRRRELLNSIDTELADLNAMVNKINFKEESKVNDSEQSNELFGTKFGSGRRTFGKANETHETRKLDNRGLLQMQQQQMKSQNKDLSVLHDIILRQKQLGVAVNDELAIQNELLEGLDEQVDQSTNKLNLAKSKVNKIT